MDNNNWRPAQGEPNMVDAPDWRNQLQADSRQRIVNEIMDTLKRHLPISGPEGLLELKKIAVRFEEEIYTAATSQSDYLRKISLKMLTMETKSQNTGAANSLPQNPVVGNQIPPDQASIDSTSQTGHTNTDWQEEAYQKIKAMKEMYLPDLNEMYQKICFKFQQQHESLAQLPKEHIERFKMMKSFMECVIQLLQVSKSSIPHSHKDKMAGFEKQIVNFLNAHRAKKPVSSHQGQQHLQAAGGHTLSMPQQQQPQPQQHDNQMNPQMPY